MMTPSAVLLFLSRKRTRSPTPACLGVTSRLAPRCCLTRSRRIVSRASSRWMYSISVSSGSGLGHLLIHLFVTIFFFFVVSIQKSVRINTHRLPDDWQ